MNQPDRVKFNPLAWTESIKVKKRKLPHWEQPGGCYFVTFRLADSLPKERVEALRQEREDWLTLHPRPWSEKVEREYGQCFTKREEEWLDAGYGSCSLQSEKIRKIVRDSIEKFDGDRYDLDCYVLMPNHVHLIWQMRDSHTLTAELRTLKGVTARYCNQALDRSGTFWMRESYDRLVRDLRELEAFRDYIESNGSMAALGEGQFFVKMNHRLSVY